MSFEFFDPSFFDTLFPGEAEDGRDLGYAVLALYPGGKFDPDPRKGPTQLRFFSWPSQREDLIAFCLHNTDLDIYMAPALFGKRGSREASNIKYQWAAYADADSLDLRKLKAEPTMIVETSPSRHRLYWVTTVNNTKQLTEISRAIAYTHADDGCDKSGWDAGQLLRVPGTANNKPDVISRYGGPFEVRLKGDPGQPYSGLSRLKELYPAPVSPAPSPLKTSMPDSGKWRHDPKVMEEVAQIFHYAPDIHSMYVNKAPQGRRSDTLWRLLSTLSRHGASRLAAMHIAWGARCNKFAEDGRTPEELWRVLCKAFDDPENKPVTTSIEVAERTRMDALEENPENQFRQFASSISILRDDERTQVPSDTFIDHYTAWASTRTDAPEVYHRAGAVTLLTCIFGEFGTCPTRFDSNLTLWFLLLGPTTRARKTTAMMLWVDLLMDLENERFDYKPISDVTSEGLSMVLAKRDRKTTLFFRDEVHGLLDEKDSKRYFAGFLEHLTELYGGRVRVRVRASSVPGEEEDTPTGSIRTNFVSFLCGTLDQVTDKLTIENYQSGFLARFLTAEANPPEQTEEEMYFEQYDGDEEEEDVHRLALISDLSRSREFWLRSTRPGRTRRVPFTPDAWDRLQKAMFQIKKASKEDRAAEALEPTAHRMGISVMKCAVLLAMSEQKLTVEMRHILKAIQLAEEWLASTATIAGRIMHSSWSARREEVLNLIASRTDGVTQREVYSRFGAKMQEKEIESALSVLMKAEAIRKTNERGRIRYVRVARA